MRYANLRRFSGLSLLLLAGCFGTVAPKPVVMHQASYDGTNATSGILSMDTKTGTALITPSARERYNAFLQRYGDRLPPPRPLADAGLTPTSTNTWVATDEAIARLGVMTGYYWQDK